MKKIIPFLFFLPLVLLSLYLGFSQWKGAKPSITATNTARTDISPTQADVKALPVREEAVNVSTHINLVISSPESGSTTENSSVQVVGTAGKNITIMINDIELNTGANDEFKATVKLDEGDNYISIVAYDEEGNVAEREILITRSVSDL